MKVIESTEYVDTQSMPLTTSILSIVKDLSPEDDISNALYSKLTQNFTITIKIFKISHW